mgnify:CR=1 FL=1
MNWIYHIDNIAVAVTTPDKTELGSQELQAYVDRGKTKYGKRLMGISIDIDGEEAAIDYVMGAPKFERIRRITGYLVGTTDRFNDGKRAEESDRVKHDF